MLTVINFVRCGCGGKGRGEGGEGGRGVGLEQNTYGKERL